MASLKTYSVENDITGSVVDLKQLNSEVIVGDDVAGFNGLRLDGDALQVLGSVLSDEPALDIVIRDHVPV